MYRRIDSRITLINPLFEFVLRDMLANNYNCDNNHRNAILTILHILGVRGGCSARMTLVNCTIHNHTRLHFNVVHSHRIKINITYYLLAKREA